MDHMAANVRQTEVAALELEGELFVVKTKQMKNGGLDVVNWHHVVNGAEAELVGLTDRLPGFDAAAGKPHGEGFDVMVTAYRLS